MAFPDTQWLLTPDQAGRADAHYVEMGGDSWDLMLAASGAVAQHLMSTYPKGPVLVVCGPGNNGADGLVAAAKLRKAGWPVKVVAWPEAIEPGDPSTDPNSDRGKAISAWGQAVPLATNALPDVTYIMDGLFGAGLNKDLGGDAASLVQSINDASSTVIAIDIPSGVDGRTGAVRGAAVRADATVTFFRPKPGHYLQPGRQLAGLLDVAEIGLAPANVAEPEQLYGLNHPDCWASDIPDRKMAEHKYQRGRLWILGGPWMTGAAALAGGAGLRAGAGLVGIAAPSSATPSLRQRERALLVAEIDGVESWDACLKRFRPDSVVMGPGLADLPSPKEYVERGLASVGAAVLDADSLNAFGEEAGALFKQLPRQTVLTPHEGEFARLFPELKGTRIDRALAAADKSDAVLVLKGPDTVIASPDGRVLINTNGIPALATAGTGDVLAGIIGAYLARGVSAFSAAAAGVYNHAEAARAADDGTAGVIADDLLLNISKA